MKTVFIAHPIAGDIEQNVRKVLAICKAVHTKEVVPYAPYIVSLQYLSDHVKEDRQLGIDANREMLKRGLIDEFWVYGNRISRGMWEEIRLARLLRIPIITKTEETSLEYRLFLATARPPT